jgi:maltose alpha-D-glucosyltransferase / alpha-amylase
MGDNVYLGDRNGVRTPMQWSMDRNAGFSQANPQQLYLPINIDPEYHYEAVNVEIQQTNSHSLLWWMKRLLSVRKQFKAFGRGTLDFLEPENRRVLAFYRKFEQERILVVANLSRLVQSVALDLSPFKSLTPVEMLGRSELPEVGDTLYHITLSPYAFYWLSFEDRRESIEARPGAGVPTATFRINSWVNPFDRSLRASLVEALPAFLKSRRWFNPRDRSVQSVNFYDILPLRPTSALLLLTRVEYGNGDVENYVLFASFATGETAARVQTEFPEAVAGLLTSPDGGTGILYSALWDDTFANTLLEAIARRRRFRGENGELIGWPLRAFGDTGLPEMAVRNAVDRSGKTNNSFVLGDRFILKLFRHVASFCQA